VLLKQRILTISAGFATEIFLQLAALDLTPKTVPVVIGVLPPHRYVIAAVLLVAPI
jgi:hypothetical protein